jgi:hypothetical protein
MPANHEVNPFRCPATILERMPYPEISPNSGTWRPTQEAEAGYGKTGLHVAVVGDHPDLKVQRRSLGQEVIGPRCRH